jgi:hypothetical protein
MKKIEFDDDKVAKVVDTLVHVGYLWNSLESPIVRLALEQTVRRLGGQVRVWPELKETWDTDLELAVVDKFLVVRLPCGNAELVVDLLMPHRLMLMYDCYFDYAAPDHRYDVIWGSGAITSVPLTTLCVPPSSTVTGHPLQFLGPWRSVNMYNIVYQYEMLRKDFAWVSPCSQGKTIRFLLADVQSPVKQGDLILFPRDAIAGHWARHLTLIAAALAATA